MKFKGCFHGVSRDVKGNLILSFRAFEERVLGQIDAIKDEGTLAVEVAKPAKKRSLSANAYYWVLVGKLAGKLGISNNRCHNLLLRRYGTIETIDGERVVTFVPDTDDASEATLEAETYHLKPTTAVKVFKDGSTRRMYFILRGSSQYNTEEMARLIKGTVSECNDMGIETMTPQEIEAMVSAYGKHHANR